MSSEVRRHDKHMLENMLCFVLLSKARTRFYFCHSRELICLVIFEQRIMTALIEQGDDMGLVTPIELTDPQKEDDPQCPAHFRQSLM